MREAKWGCLSSVSDSPMDTRHQMHSCRCTQHWFSPQHHLNIQRPDCLGLCVTVWCMHQEEEAYGQQLEQQIAVLRAASGAVEATTRQQAEAQGPMYFTLTAHAGRGGAAFAFGGRGGFEHIPFPRVDGSGVYGSRPKRRAPCHPHSTQVGAQQPVPRGARRGRGCLEACPLALTPPLPPTLTAPLPTAPCTPSCYVHVRLQPTSCQLPSWMRSSWQTR